MTQLSSMKLWEITSGRLDCVEPEWGCGRGVLGGGASSRGEGNQGRAAAEVLC